MSGRSQRIALMTLLAAAGLALAIGLAVLTSSLTTQHVGLAGEPPRPARLVAPVPSRVHTAPAAAAPARAEGADDGRGDD
jgi:hypothetical protein